MRYDVSHIQNLSYLSFKVIANFVFGQKFYILEKIF